MGMEYLIYRELYVRELYFRFMRDYIMLRVLQVYPASVVVPLLLIGSSMLFPKLSKVLKKIPLF